MTLAARPGRLSRSRSCHQPSRVLSVIASSAEVWGRRMREAALGNKLDGTDSRRITSAATARTRRRSSPAKLPARLAQGCAAQARSAATKFDSALCGPMEEQLPRRGALRTPTKYCNHGGPELRRLSLHLRSFSKHRNDSAFMNSIAYGILAWPLLTTAQARR